MYDSVHFFPGKLIAGRTRAVGSYTTGSGVLPSRGALGVLLQVQPPGPNREW
jgi:hypothetical protein